MDGFWEVTDQARLEKENEELRRENRILTWIIQNLADQLEAAARKKGAEIDGR